MQFAQSLRFWFGCRLLTTMTTTRHIRSICAQAKRRRRWQSGTNSCGTILIFVTILYSQRLIARLIIPVMLSERRHVMVWQTFHQTAHSTKPMNIIYYMIRSICIRIKQIKNLLNEDLQMVERFGWYSKVVKSTSAVFTNRNNQSTIKSIISEPTVGSIPCGANRPVDTPPCWMSSLTVPPRVQYNWIRLPPMFVFWPVIAGTVRRNNRNG